MSILIIDNYDSFTYNLFQLIGEVTQTAALVRRNDALTIDQIRNLSPSHIILSPGPGHPSVPRDFGVSSAIIRELAAEIPILGVCLGHQGIVHVLGGQVVRAPEIVHGKTSLVRHRGEGLFAGLEQPLRVMRYHSLIAERASLPASLKITAELEDGMIMGVQHKTWPLYGVQFHPESIGTSDGHALIKNFLNCRVARLEAAS